MARLPAGFFSCSTRFNELGEALFQARARSLSCRRFSGRRSIAGPVPLGSWRHCPLRLLILRQRHLLLSRLPASVHEAEVGSCGGPDRRCRSQGTVRGGVRPDVLRSLQQNVPDRLLGRRLWRRAGRRVLPKSAAGRARAEPGPGDGLIALGRSVRGSNTIGNRGGSMVPSW